MSKHLSPLFGYDRSSNEINGSLGREVGSSRKCHNGFFSYRQYAGASFTSRANLAKLGPVPVFTITDNKGAPLVASNK